VDGIIFLSAYSRQLIGELYPESRARRSLNPVMGHYRDTAVTPLSPSPIPNPWRWVKSTSNAATGFLRAVGPLAAGS
jgi:hypothetical protein